MHFILFDTCLLARIKDTKAYIIYTSNIAIVPIPQFSLIKKDGFYTVT